MIARIHSTTITVSDQDAALDFYVGKLGWEKRIDYVMEGGYRFLTVAPPGAQTEMALGVAGAIPGTAPREPGTDRESGISFAVENFDETYRTLVERGVRFTWGPEEMPWGDKGAWMADPDGNTFFLNGV